MKVAIRFFKIFFVLLIGIMWSCQQQGGAEKELNNSTGKSLADTTLVPVAMVKLTTFSNQTWSNGTIEAMQKAVVTFPIQGNIVAIAVKNGQQVTAGQVLASLDNNRQLQDVKQAQIAYEKSLLELEDQLLRLGHNLNDTASLSISTLSMIKLRSGFKEAELQLSKARYELGLTTIKAPVSGIVTGLQAQNHSPTSEYKNLCTLLNNRLMKVSFALLESDAGLVRPGMPVKIFPVALPGKEVTGRISEIEPIIDKNGSLKVCAEVQNPSSQLLDGMNVRVVVESVVANQWVIPKSAVLARQGRQVVFTVENGLAIWNYVTTGYENTSYYTITEGLTEGQIIITGNNLTIGHQAPVKILENN